MSSKFGDVRTATALFINNSKQFVERMSPVATNSYSLPHILKNKKNYKKNTAGQDRGVGGLGHASSNLTNCCQQLLFPQQPVAHKQLLFRCLRAN